MRNLAKTCVVIAACLALADAAWAVVLPVDMSLPFVSVSVDGEPADMGTMSGPGPRTAMFQFRAHIVANCPYHVAAFFQSFRHVQGKAVMSAKDVSATVNGIELPMDKGQVTVAKSSSSTPASGVNVPLLLRMKVKGLDQYPQGPYRGALVIRVTAGP